MARSQSRNEEIANSVSHGLALLAAIAGVAFLLDKSSGLHTLNVMGMALFGSTMVLLYCASTLYHALPDGRAKRIFCKIDHGAIYLFIAGTYTPFALGTLHGPWDWALFGLVWTLALLGVTLKSFDLLTHPWLSTGLYLGMGWLALFAVMPAMERVASAGLTLLVAGGIAYTAGVVFFLLDARVRYAHAVWHAFVATGTGLHFFAVLDYAA